MTKRKSPANKQRESYTHISCYVDNEFGATLLEYVETKLINKSALIRAALAEYMDNHP